jgi:threonine dehydratase
MRRVYRIVMSTPTLEDIRQAHQRIRAQVHRTPVLSSRVLGDAVGATLFFKCENLQKVGAFKARGALNAVMSLSDDDARHGVATHSSGNHAAALAWAAGLRGIPAYVVMPSNASPFKRAAVERYGGKVIPCEPTHQAREQTATRVVAETGAALVHPFDDPRVIAGQGTAALELLEEVADLDAIVCPVGGGGLLAGTAIVASALKPGIRILAGEPEGADDAFRSLRDHRRQSVDRPTSIADGLLAGVGALTFPVIDRHVKEIGTVSDGQIRTAVRRLLEVLKVVVEPSGAVAYAAVAEGKLDVRGARAGIILSGGNVDLDAAPWGPGKTP